MESTYFFKSNFLIPPSFSIITILHSSDKDVDCSAQCSLFSVQSPHITDNIGPDWSLSSPQMMIQQQKGSTSRVCEVEKRARNYKSY